MVTDRVLELVIKTKDESYALALSAFNNSHELALAAKDNEILYLKNDLAEVKTQLKYEKARADNLVDRLLIKEAKVAAVSPMAVEAARMKDDVAVKNLKVIFDQMNDIGEVPTQKDTRVFEMAGGSVVMR